MATLPSENLMAIPDVSPITPQKGTYGLKNLDNLEVIPYTPFTSPAGSETTPGYFDKADAVFDTPDRSSSDSGVFDCETPSTPPDILNSVSSTDKSDLAFPETPTKRGQAMSSSTIPHSEPESPSFFKSSGRTIFEEFVARAEEDVQKVKKELLKEETDLPSQKLVRHMTAKMEQLTEEHELQFSSKLYNLKPVFNFRIDANISVTATACPQTPKRRGRVLTAYEKQQRKLEEIISHQVYQRLKDDPEKCVASLIRKSTQRCSKPVKRSMIEKDIVMLEDKLAIVETLSKTCKSSQLEDIIGQLPGVANITMCSSHHNTALDPTRLKALQDCLDLTQDPLPTDESIQTLRALHDWINAIAQQETGPSEVKPEPIESESKAEVFTSSASSNAFVFKAKNLITRPGPLPQFQPYQSNVLVKQSVQEALKSFLTKNPTDTDATAGYIYIYWIPGAFNKIKIGRSNNPQRRIKEWNRSCKVEHELHISSYDGKLAKVPHVKRIERLLHLELKNLRYSMSECDGCKKNHNEWFDLSERVAVRVFGKWREWIESKPYEKNANGVWELTEAAREKLDEICEPVSLHDDGGLTPHHGSWMQKVKLNGKKKSRKSLGRR
ncbi:meiotically up-regulated gene 113-domain-containing protein [Dendryphion nanum]|uniref:Meiotically up-regulated gene 113-domain-containing protein n=1 Tax=Dendryphion nanum TaxID=256645 RepID=A0A9P9CYQ0_9PLEO|nr:meiotically up-regulated gene 113-domain-containing protein [Dendryphion nanum]